MTKKVLLSRISNFTLILFSIYASVIIYQRWVARDERESQPAQAFKALTLTNSQIQIPPNDGKPSILVFWATWCGPCKLELDRLKTAVEQNEIPADRIFAVSIGETLEDVQATAKERQYPFQVVADERAQSRNLYQISVTPTTIHVDGSENIAWVAQGMHPLSIKRAKSHLKN
jgi:cytochrome c biogenesis protein CcmG, thiol:disulfide interchange protein DsbE